MAKSTRKRSKRKPSGFPLTRHPRGYWCKKVKGKLHYFGRIDADPDGQAALELWLDQKDDLLAGRIPRSKRNGLTVRDAVNEFLHFKQQMVDSGELASRSFAEYVATGKIIVKHLARSRLVADLTPGDFQRFRAVLAGMYGPVRLGNTIQRVRSVFKFAFDSELIDRPVRFGPGFKRPSAKMLRQARIERGLRMFSADELRAVLEHATPNTKAMVLLGINGGLGNRDVADLPVSALDLAGGWLDYPRGKTAVNRRIPLWPDTVKAIREAIDQRPEPQNPDDARRVFINRWGRAYAVDGRTEKVGRELNKAMDKAGVNGRTFYDLRRTFETIAGETRDQVAVDAVMGHAPKSSDMAAVYRQMVSDDRLRAVVDYVRCWLYQPDTDGDQVDTDEPLATVKFPVAS